MVKDRFLSTTSASTLLSPNQSGRQSIIGLSERALDVAGQNFDNKLRAAEQSYRETQARGQLAGEKKRQLELNIPNAARNIQRAQLNTLNTLLGLQEAARQEKETKEANAYSLQTSSEISLDFLKSQRDIASGVGKDGSGLFDNTKAWWDAKEKAIIDSAPSEKAKIKALESFYAKKTNALGDAIINQMKAKDSFIAGQINQSQENLISEVRFDPNQYEESLKGFDAIEANLESNGYSKEQIETQRNFFNKNLLLTKTESLLERVKLNPSNLGEVDKILSDKSNRELLGEKNVEQLVSSFFKEGKRAAQSVQTQNTEIQLLDKWREGKLNPHSTTQASFVNKQFEAFQQGVEQQISAIQDPAQQAEAYNALKIEFAKNSPFIPDAEIRASEFRLLNESNPEKAVAEANYIVNISRDRDTVTKFKGYSSESLTRATLINLYSSTQGLSPAEAVEKVNGIFTRSLDGRAPEVREEHFKKLTRDNGLGGVIYDDVIKTDAMNLLERVNSNVDQSFLFGLDNSLEESAEMFKTEYIDQLKEVYKLVGDEKAAVATTDLIMQQKLGVTEQNGVQSLMFNPPELFFQGEGKEYFDYVKEQKIKQLGVQDKVGLSFERVDGDSVIYKLINEGSKLPIMESVNGYQQEARLKVSRKGSQQLSLMREKQSVMNPELFGIFGGILPTLEEQKAYFTNNPSKASFAGIDEEAITAQEERIKIINNQLKEIDG